MTIADILCIILILIGCYAILIQYSEMKWNSEQRKKEREELRKADKKSE